MDRLIYKNIIKLLYPMAVVAKLFLQLIIENKIFKFKIFPEIIRILGIGHTYYMPYLVTF